jgi:hypothetical protein
MTGPYFEPRIGGDYHRTKVMILSESAYSWRHNGIVVDPGPSHPTENLNHWGIKNFGRRGYYIAMGRALCGKMKPSRDDLWRAWDEYAYTIFVQGTVGLGPKSRPSVRQWKEAEPHFLSLIEKMKIRPLKVIVTGKTMWNSHMVCKGPHFCDDVQAHKLSDGSLVWCLAVPHPASRKKGSGFQWESVGKSIRTFRSINFPLRES